MEAELKFNVEVIEDKIERLISEIAIKREACNEVEEELPFYAKEMQKMWEDSNYLTLKRVKDISSYLDACLRVITGWDDEDIY